MYTSIQPCDSRRLQSYIEGRSGFRAGLDGRAKRAIRAPRQGGQFDRLRNCNYSWGMIAMAVEDDWVSVENAAKIAGCSQQYIRRDLLEHVEDDACRTSGGRLEGWRPNGKAWLVSRRSAEALAASLSTRARKNAAARKAAKPKRKK